MNAQIDFFDEIIVDNFAGGGGASTGIELAAGRPVAIAINHDPDAILFHKTNHPYTEHLQASVWDVDPVEVCRGRPVGLAWFSPDCKHFSKAKGAALVNRNIRGLAWIVLRWAGTVRPRVIMLENVEEFQTWGPVRKGKPVKSKAGETFRKWKQQLQDLGYEIEHRELVAADYGAPTTRKRFVLVARCDGKPIIWPERTHAPRDSDEVKSGKCLPWRGAYEIIDWSQPSYSIFESKQEIKKKYGINAVRPLADNTLRRVIRGVDKFTIKSGKPFLVPMGYGERKGQQPRVHDVEKPLPTVVGRDKHGVCQPVVAPFVAECNHGGDGHVRGVDEPLNTITGKYAGGVVQPVIAPFIAQQKIQNAAQDIVKPLSTITTVGSYEVVEPIIAPFTFSNTGGSVGSCAADPVHTIRTSGGQALAAANLIQYHTEQSEKIGGQGMDDPVMTLDASNRYGLTTATLVEYYGNGNPLDITQPMHTATTHDREALASAHIQKYYGGVIGVDPREALPTDHNAICSAHMVKFRSQELGTDMRDPLPTVTTAGHFAECRAVLVKASSQENLGYWPQIRVLLNEHCGYNLADDEVILLIIDGVAYFIADILLRMLIPREQYDAMSFPHDYAIEYDYLGNKYPKNHQTAKCGNAVCPVISYAMVWANFPEWCGVEINTMSTLYDRMTAI